MSPHHPRTRSQAFKSSCKKPSPLALPYPSHPHLVFPIHTTSHNPPSFTPFCSSSSSAAVAALHLTTTTTSDARPARVDACFFLLDHRPRATSSPARLAAREARDQRVEERNEQVDDGLEDGADRVQDRGQAGPDRMAHLL